MLFVLSLVSFVLALLLQVPDTTVAAPDFIPATHILSWFWAFMVSGAATLLYEGVQRYSEWMNKMSATTKRAISIGVQYAIAIGFTAAGIAYPVDPLSWTGAGFITIVNGLMGFGAHSLLFAKKK